MGFRYDFFYLTTRGAFNKLEIRKYLRRSAVLWEGILQYDGRGIGIQGVYK